MGPMGKLGMRRSILFLACGVLATGSLLCAGMACGQEIPLEYCDTLPVVDVQIAGRHSWFLVDTGATSILNLKSFADGARKDIFVSSWTGTLATSATDVTLPEMTIGRTTFLKPKLPAIDLSEIGKACGRQIDGILGVDLLNKLGASIDLKQGTLHVTTAEEAHAAELAKAMRDDMHRCMAAFNDSDEPAFADCLDPKIELFSGETELSGRDEVIGYFRDRYFHQKPAAKLEIEENGFHAIGEAVWYEYEFTIDSARGKLRGRGMAMCHKSEGHWRMASMHHSVMEWVAAGSAHSKPEPGSFCRR
jgi:ketosteroid isomerase-like protein/predicted aspartyl protease